MKKLYGFLFFLVFGVAVCLNGMDAKAATKEYNIEVLGTVGKGSTEYNLSNKCSALESLSGKVSGITSSNPSVASLEVYVYGSDDDYDDEDFDDGIDDDIDDYSTVYASIKKGNLGKYDFTFDCGEDRYVIHLNVVAQKLKTKKVKTLFEKGKKIYLSDNDEYDFPLSGSELTSISSSNTKVVGVNKNYIAVKKPGTAVISYVGTVSSDDVEDGLDYIRDDDFEIYAEGKINVEILSVAEAKKDAIAKANTFLAKKSSKAKIAYVDIDFDGVKDIVVDKKVYVYNPTKAKYERYYCGFYGTADKIYVSKSKKRVMFLWKGKDKSKYTYNKGMQYYEICKKGVIENYYVSNIPSKTRKLYRISSKYKYGIADIEVSDGSLYIRGISKAKFNKATKTGMAGKKLVKTYTNTAKNRKKIVK